MVQLSPSLHDAAVAPSSIMPLQLSSSPLQVVSVVVDNGMHGPR